MTTRALPTISTRELVPRQKRLLHKNSFPALTRARLFSFSVLLRLTSAKEISKFRKQMQRCICREEPCETTVAILDESKKIRNVLYKTYKEFEEIEGLYFTKKHLRFALTDWDDFVEDLTASTDMELRALAKNLAGLFK